MLTASGEMQRAWSKGHLPSSHKNHENLYACQVAPSSIYLIVLKYCQWKSAEWMVSVVAPDHRTMLLGYIRFIFLVPLLKIYSSEEHIQLSGSGPT